MPFEVTRDADGQAMDRDSLQREFDGVKHYHFYILVDSQAKRPDE